MGDAVGDSNDTLAEIISYHLTSLPHLPTGSSSLHNMQKMYSNLQN